MDEPVTQAVFNEVLQMCQTQLSMIPDAIEQETVRELPWRESQVLGPSGKYERWQVNRRDKTHSGRIIRVIYKVSGKPICSISEPMTPRAFYSIVWDNVRPIIYGDPFA